MHQSPARKTWTTKKWRTTRMSTRSCNSTLIASTSAHLDVSASLSYYWQCGPCTTASHSRNTKLLSFPTLRSYQSAQTTFRERNPSLTCTSSGKTMSVAKSRICSSTDSGTTVARLRQRSYVVTSRSLRKRLKSAMPTETSRKSRKIMQIRNPFYVCSTLSWGCSSTSTMR